ncbi:hypothetical protein ACXM5X_30990 [Pseudomonas saponiphila]
MITDFLNEHDRQLLAHEKGFQDLVLQHMRALPALEWMRFRTIARDNSAWGDAAARSLYKHEEVLHASLNLPCQRWVWATCPNPMPPGPAS